MFALVDYIKIVLLLGINCLNGQRPDFISEIPAGDFSQYRITSISPEHIGKKIEGFLAKLSQGGGRCFAKNMKQTHS
jgi:hypothetical protein